MGLLSNLFKKEAKKDEDGLRARLESVFEKEWSDYEISREVPASLLGAEDGARSYSYGMYKDGQLRAVIMVLNGKSEYRLKAVQLAQTASRMNNIPYMNFMSYLPSTMEYISNRLKENVN